MSDLIAEDVIRRLQNLSNREHVTDVPMPRLRELALDCLQVLRHNSQRLTELESAQKWTSVEDELPKECCLVLAIVVGLTDPDIRGYQVGSGDWLKEISFPEGWEVSNDVTHWMPLPKPLKPTPPGTQSDTKMMYAWTKP